ncbi:MAG: hypothetical protein AVO39_07735 [delta proteobacterium MLS_D]|jgi:LEA14-like dessication related protein|nr:MAG: hypothetical protein AVO39_07735 [delta proteobacterium MLS_D]
MSTWKKLFAVLFPLFVLLPAACARLAVKPPSVTVAGIEIIEAGFFEQRFAFTLRVQNPNEIDIPLKGLRFAVEINGRPFARGVSDQVVTIPRLGEEIIDVTAVSTITGLLRLVDEWRRGDATSLSYRISGTLSTALPGGIDFEESGVLETPRPTRDNSSHDDD